MEDMLDGKEIPGEILEIIAGGVFRVTRKQK